MYWGIEQQIFYQTVLSAALSSPGEHAKKETWGLSALGTCPSYIHWRLATSIAVLVQTLNVDRQSCINHNLYQAAVSSRDTDANLVYSSFAYLHFSVLCNFKNSHQRLVLTAAPYSPMPHFPKWRIPLVSATTPAPWHINHSCSHID